MQVPVVVGLNGGQGHGAVWVVLEALAGEAGEGRETQRTENAVGVHVVDTVHDAPGTTAHLVVAQRLHAVFLFRATDHGIEAHVTGGLLLEHPDVAFVTLDHMRLASFEARRHMAGKGIWRLNRVIIDADENQIFNLHCFSPSLSGS
ncbi:hypothetical protein D3C85_187520 [compost metagenome]